MAVMLKPTSSTFSVFFVAFKNKTKLLNSLLIGAISHFGDIFVSLFFIFTKDSDYVFHELLPF